MEAIVATKELRATVARAEAVVNANHRLPMASKLLIKADDEMVKFVGTDFETTITTWTQGSVIKQGAAAIAARPLKEWLPLVKKDDVHISLESSGRIDRMLRFTAGRQRLTLDVVPADEFPPVPNVEGTGLWLKASFLKSALEQVVVCAAKENDRPVLAWVQVSITAGQVVFVGADGYRLGVRDSLHDPNWSEDLSVIVPRNAVLHLGKLLPDTDEKVNVIVSENRGQAAFRWGQVHLVSQLIQGKFPNTDTLIPEGYTSRAVVNREEFLAATTRVGVFGRENNDLINLRMCYREEGMPEMSLDGSASEIGECKVTVAIELEGKGGNIAFASKYLADALNVMPTEKVALEISSATSAGVLRPVGMDEYVHVIMPIYVGSVGERQK